MVFDKSMHIAWSQVFFVGGRVSTRARAQHWGKNRACGGRLRFHCQFQEAAFGHCAAVGNVLSANPSLSNEFVERAAHHVRRTVDAVGDTAAEGCGRF
ncbi:hypothetical protein DMP08_02430 [Paraeggerthella hongkongensis]|uniref:Uncharacterized protein n=1 Tax=Paraeggerthella hongkongensis TaxID=230658 RepID=A0A3N0BJM9_9ACTN|nr:hypothetical protein DMP08_02430 [Paraeggerthella hongkongensis]